MLDFSGLILMAVVSLGGWVYLLVGVISLLRILSVPAEWQQALARSGLAFAMAAISGYIVSQVAGASGGSLNGTDWYALPWLLIFAGGLLAIRYAPARLSLRVGLSGSENRHQARVQRLPGRLILAVMLVEMLLFIGDRISLARWLAAQGSAYHPSWFLLANLIVWSCTATLLAVLAWALTRHHVDRRGAAAVPRPVLAFWLFLIAFTVLLFLSVWLMATYREPVRAHLLGWLQQLGIHDRRIQENGYLAIVTAVAVGKDVICMLSALAGALCLGQRPRAAKEGTMRIPARHTAPFACAAFFTAGYWALGYGLSALWHTQLYTSPLGSAALVLGPPFVFALSFAGARLGCGVPVRSRPLRVLGVAWLALLLQGLFGTVITLIWVWLVPDPGIYFPHFGRPRLLVLLVAVQVPAVFGTMWWLTHRSLRGLGISVLENDAQPGPVRTTENGPGSI